MKNLTNRQLNVLKKKRLGEKEQLIRLEPLKYLDCRKNMALNENLAGKPVTIIGSLQSISTKERNDKLMVLIKIKDIFSNRNLNITFFGNYNIYRLYKNSLKINFMVHGKLEYNPDYHSFSMLNPNKFIPYMPDSMKIYAEYSKFKGLNEEAIPIAIENMKNDTFDEYIPIDLLYQYGIYDINQAKFGLHFPKNEIDIMKAKQRLIFDDMLAFSLGMKEKERSNGKPFVHFNKTSETFKIISDLPYKLTDDQFNTISDIYNEIGKNGRLSALIQGDVSCGKTITAMLLMFIAAENGYQSLLMAPTIVLASQHYEDMKQLCEKYNKKVVFLKTGLKESEKNEIYKQIKDGTVDFIISTHSGVSDAIEYNNLGLAVIDEEHKFGVATREKVKEKSAYDLPFITMSATPIPRSLASIIFGDLMKIYAIKSMPAGRKPVTTFCHTTSDVPEILKKELEKGRQGYIVCPLIEEAEKDSLMEQCMSVEETYEKYKKELPEYNIEILTGKTADDEVLRILKDFKDNKIQVLISTTVIEVGVNNPNATVMILQNAERYGISTIHQLRGRVKRGYYEGYCVLVSKQGTVNERLNVICQTEDGFKIAEEDLRLRKSGNLLGVEQSGKNKTIELIETYPDFYQKVKSFADIMVQKGYDKQFLQYMSDL